MAKTFVLRRYVLLLAIILCAAIVPNGSGPVSRLPSRVSEPLLSENVPFDLVENNFSDGSPKRDVNGLMMNPQWSSQYDLNIAPDPFTEKCPSPDFSDTTCVHREKNLPLLDKAGLCTILNCGIGSLTAGHSPGSRVPGHVNWGPATYTGKACLNDVSFDFDYTLNLITLQGAGLTKLNPPNTHNEGLKPKAIHTEFDSRETVRNFITEEWLRLAGQPGDNCDSKPTLCDIDNKRAIEIGLLGLDSGHSAYSELHPVYGLAIELDPNPSDSKWIIFARNRGDEGDCSTRDHPLHCNRDSAVESLSFFIPGPHRSLVSDAFLLKSTAFASNFPGSAMTCPVITRGHFGNDDGILVRIMLPAGNYGPPTDGPLVEGVLHIAWTVAGQATASDWDDFYALPDCNAALVVGEEAPGEENKDVLKSNRYLLREGLGPVGDPVPLEPLSCGFFDGMDRIRIAEATIAPATVCDRGAINRTNRNIILFHKALAKRNRQINRLLKSAPKK